MSSGMSASKPALLPPGWLCSVMQPPRSHFALLTAPKGSGVQAPLRHTWWRVLG